MTISATPPLTMTTTHARDTHPAVLPSTPICDQTFSHVHLSAQALGKATAPCHRIQLGFLPVDHFSSLPPPGRAITLVSFLSLPTRPVVPLIRLFFVGVFALISLHALYLIL